MASFRVGEVYAGSFRLAFQNFSAFLRTQGVIVLAMALVGLVFTLFIFQSVFPQILGLATDPTPDVQAVLGLVLPIVAGAIAFGIISLFIAPITYGVGLTVAEAARQGPTTMTLGEAWVSTKPRYGTMLSIILIFVGIVIVSVLAIVLVMVALASVSPALIALGFLLFVAAFVGFVMLLLRWFPVLAVALFEARGATDSLKRAAELTKGSRGSIFGLMLLFLVTFGIPSAMISNAIAPSPQYDASMTPDEIAAAAQPSMVQTILSWVFSTAIQLVSGFVGAAAMVLIYRSLTGTGTPEPALGPITSAPPPAPPPAP